MKSSFSHSRPVFVLSSLSGLPIGGMAAYWGEGGTTSSPSAVVQLFLAGQGPILSPARVLQP